MNHDEHFLEMARAAARPRCTRRHVGAVIVDTDGRVVGVGHNGTPPGEVNCTDGGCPRGKHYPIENPVYDWNPVCACGHAGWPCPEGSVPGTDYANCTGVHAEMNAIIDAGRRAAKGGTIYCTDEPCYMCQLCIKAAGIVRVVCP